MTPLMFRDRKQSRKVLNIQKMWLGGQTEFPKCRGGKGVFNVLTFQKSRGTRAHLGGINAPPPPLSLNETMQENHGIIVIKFLCHTHIAGSCYDL